MSHTHSPSIHPLPPHTEAILFSPAFYVHLREVGGSFCIQRLSMNEPPDRYHTKANTALEEEEQRDNSFISN